MIQVSCSSGAAYLWIPDVPEDVPRSRHLRPRQFFSKQHEFVRDGLRHSHCILTHLSFDAMLRTLPPRSSFRQVDPKRDDWKGLEEPLNGQVGTFSIRRFNCAWNKIPMAIRRNSEPDIPRLRLCARSAPSSFSLQTAFCVTPIR